MATPPLTFRTAAPADSGAIVALVESAYRGEASRAGWTTEADLLDGQRTDAAIVSGHIADPDARLLLAERDGYLCGSILMKREQVSTVYLGMFSVRPTEQAAGIGRHLLEHAEALAGRLWNSSVARMTVISLREELIAWYERRGYARTGEREAFPYGDARFGLPRRGDLEFVVLKKTLAR